jgi:hypothetical protein
MELSPSVLDAVMIVLIPIGGIVCLFGYHVFKFVLALIGGVVGGAFGLFLGTGMFTEGPLVYVVAAVGAGVGALLTLALHFVGVFLIGAVLGAIVGFGVNVAGGGNPEALTLAIAAVVGGILALALQRLTITVATAMLGAWGVVIGATHLSGRPVEATSLAEALLPTATEMEAAFGWWLGLTLLGIVVQYVWPVKREIRRPSATPA